MKSSLTRASKSAAMMGTILLLGPALAQAYTPQTFNASTDKGQDFTKVAAGTGRSGINTGVWNNIFGNGFTFTGSNGLLLSTAKSSGWIQTGMMQNAFGCTAGFGYGTFHYRMRAGQANQGPGMNLILWRADNKWISSALGSVYTEIDVLEVENNRVTPYATTHFYASGASNGNGYRTHTLNPSGGLTTFHDYDLVWQAGSLNEYVDGVLQYSDTSSQVPKDAAHGGCNETLGAQVAVPSYFQSNQPTGSNQMYLANAWWKSGTVTASPAPTPAPAPPVSSSTTLLKNVDSGKCIDVAGGSTANHTAVDQQGCILTDKAEIFGMLKNSDGTYSFTSGVNSASCLNAYPVTSGTALIEYTCNETQAQKFNIVSASNGRVNLKVSGSGLCVDIAGPSTAAGAKMVLNTCSSSSASQEFTEVAP